MKNWVVVSVVLCCFAVVTEAGEKIRLAVVDVVCAVGPQDSAVKARASKECVSVRVEDPEKAAKDCSVTWYETEVTCAGAVQFKGFGDCDKPISADKYITDCGKTKKTVIGFCSGKRVEIRKSGDVVTVDYDD